MHIHILISNVLSSKFQASCFLRNSERKAGSAIAPLQPVRGCFLQTCGRCYLGARIRCTEILPAMSCQTRLRRTSYHWWCFHPTEHRRVIQNCTNLYSAKAIPNQSIWVLRWHTGLLSTSKSGIKPAVIQRTQLFYHITPQILICYSKVQWW